MTVFFISTEFNYCCGVSRSIFSLVQELKKRGHHIVLGVPEGTMVNDAVEKGIEYVYLPLYPHNKKIKDFFTCIRAIRTVVKTKKIDVIHTHNRYAEFITMVAGVSGKVRTVTTSHSMILGMKHMSFRSQRVIAPSKTVEKMLLSYFKVPQHRIRRIKNIPRTLTRPSEEKIEAFKTSLRIKGDDFIVAGIGRLHTEKGFDILLKAIKEANNPKLRVIIAGKGEEKMALKEYATANNLRVDLLDELNEVELLYSIADVVVMPSRRDAAPLVAIEAAFFSKPIIASRVGGLVESIKDGERGVLVTVEDQTAFAQALDKIYKDRGFRLQIGEKLHDYIIGEYDAAAITTQIEEAYTT